MKQIYRYRHVLYLLIFSAISVVSYGQNQTLFSGLLKHIADDDSTFVSFLNQQGYTLEKRNSPTGGVVIVYTNPQNQLIIRDTGSSYYTIEWTSSGTPDFKESRKMLLTSGYKKVIGENSKYVKSEAYKKGKLTVMFFFFPNAGEAGKQAFYNIRISKEKL